MIWIGFDWGGIAAFEQHNLNKPKINLLEGEMVTSITQDTEGGYWCTTYHKGLFYFPCIDVISFSEDVGLKTNIINEVEFQKGKVWFAGNSNDLYLFDNKNIISYSDNRYKIDQIGLLKAIGDSLFIVSQGQQLMIELLYNKKRKILKTNSYAIDILVLDSSKLLFAYKELVLWNTNTHTTQIVYPKAYSDIYSLIKYSSNIVWLGTDNGLFELSLNDYKIKKIDFSPLLRIRINCLYKDSKEIIWLGTKGGGLLKIKDNIVWKLTSEDGLPGNSVNTIIEKDNALWLATNKGVAKISFLNANVFYSQDSLKTGRWKFKSGEYYKIEKFTQANGLVNNEIYDIALDSTNVYAGTNKGLSYFRQDLTGINNIPPPIYLTGVKILGQDTILQNHYELEHKQNHIEFNFVGISYQRASALQYMYKLEGADNKWKITENKTVQYPLLPPGYYTFMVKAYNRSGIESKHIEKLSFRINKAFYQTTIFKVLVFLGILIVIFVIFTVFFYIKLKEIKKRNIIVQELNKFRQRALSAQMNPHFIYNSLNSVQSYIFKNDKFKSSEYLSKFSNLMRRVLENSQHPLISLQEELDALKMYVDMELIRFRNNFSFQLNVNNNVNMNKVKVPPLILQPYVENAIHHGLRRSKKDDKKVELSVISKNEYLCIEIEDNGIGRNAASERKHMTKSYGTQITDKRLSLYKELYENDVKISIIDLADKQNKPLGTKVKILIDFSIQNKKTNESYNNR